MTSKIKYPFHIIWSTRTKSEVKLLPCIAIIFLRIGFVFGYVSSCGVDIDAQFLLMPNLFLVKGTFDAFREASPWRNGLNENELER